MIGSTTLRARLTTWYGVFLLLILGFFGAGLYATVEHTLYKGTDDKLLALAKVVGQTEPKGPLPPGMDPFRGFLDEFFNTRSRFIQVLDPSGNVGSWSSNLDRGELAVSKAAIERAGRGLSTYETTASGNFPKLRTLTHPVVRRGRVSSVIQVATSLETIEETLSTLFWILTLGLPALLVVALGIGWFVAGRALKPVSEVIESINGLDADKLDSRIARHQNTAEVRELAENFNSLLDRIEEAFKKVKQFSADASHELRTPLTVLKGEAEVALRKERSPDEYKAVIASSVQEIDRMTRIVQNLLLLSKGDLGEIPITPEKVDLSFLLEEVSEKAKVMAENKGLVFRAEPPLTPVILAADPLHLRQLIWNLLDNAIKYTPRGGSVLLRHAPVDDSWAIVEVEDTGIGISEADKEKIFERFHRVDDSRASSDGGSGLGLAISQWAAKMHGGRIEVESAPEEGSRFKVYLPVKGSPAQR